MDTTRLQLHTEQLWEWHEDYQNYQPFYSYRYKGKTTMGREGVAGIWSGWDPHPDTATHRQEGYHILPEQQEVQDPHQAPSPWESALGRQVPIMSCFANQEGLTLGELAGYRKPRLSPSKNHTQTHLLQDPAQEQQCEKYLSQVWRFMPNFKGYAGETGIYRNFLQGWKYWEGTIFLTLLLPSQPSTGGCHFWYYPSTLLAQLTLPWHFPTDQSH